LPNQRAVPFRSRSGPRAFCVRLFQRLSTKW
jgi:hypothetical protein